MKRLALLALIMFVLAGFGITTQAKVQQQVLFSTMVGGQGDDNLSTIAVDHDGTIYTGGFTSTQWNQSALQAILVKILPSGEIITKTLGLEGVDKIVDILIPADPADAHIWIALDSSSDLYTQYTYTVDGTEMSDMKLFRLKKSDLSEVFSITIGDVDDENAVMLFEQGQHIGILGTSRSFAYPGTVPGTRQGLNDPVVTVINYRAAFPDVVVSKYLTSPDHQTITSALQEEGKIYFVGQDMNQRGDFTGYVRGYDIWSFQPTQPLTLGLSFDPTDIESIGGNLHVVGYKSIPTNSSGEYRIASKNLQLVGSYSNLPAISNIESFNNGILMATYHRDNDWNHPDIGFRYWDNGSIGPLVYRLGSTDYDYLWDLEAVGQELLFSGNTTGRNYPVTNGSTYQGHYEGFFTKIRLTVAPGQSFKVYLPKVIK